MRPFFTCKLSVVFSVSLYKAICIERMKYKTRDGEYIVYTYTTRHNRKKMHTPKDHKPSEINERRSIAT